MLDLKINIFKNAEDSYSHYITTVGTVLKYIKEGRWQEKISIIRHADTKEFRDSLKKELPAVTFCGTFLTKRFDQNIRGYTGIVCLDIDKVDEKTLNKLKRDLVEDEYCFCFFESPSRGLKCLFEVDSFYQHHKPFAFVQVREYFEMRYNVKVDASGSNLARLCFISWDPNLFYSADKAVFSVSKSEPQDDFIPVLKYKKKTNGVQDAVYSFRVCKKWVEDKGVFYVKGQRNLYLYRLCCNLNRAGFEMDDMIYYIHKEHSISKEMRGEVVACARSASKNKNEFNTNPIWLKSNQPNLFGEENFPKENS